MNLPWREPGFFFFWGGGGGGGGGFQIKVYPEISSDEEKQ